MNRVEFSKKHKHEAMKRVWSSVQIPLETKKQLLSKLEAEVGEGEWLDNTRKYCDAAHFENKEKIWKLITSKEKNETENWGLAESKSLYAGWNQVQHHQYTEQFEQSFFEQIGRVVSEKS